MLCSFERILVSYFKSNNNNNNNNNNNHNNIYSAVIYGASHMLEFTMVHLDQSRSTPVGRQLTGQAANLTFESACKSVSIFLLLFTELFERDMEFCCWQRQIAFDELSDVEQIAEGGFGNIYRAIHHEWGTVVYKELESSFIVEGSKSVILSVCTSLTHVYVLLSKVVFYMFFSYIENRCQFAFSVLTLNFLWQEGHPAWEKYGQETAPRYILNGVEVLQREGANFHCDRSSRWITDWGIVREQVSRGRCAAGRMSYLFGVTMNSGGPCTNNQAEPFLPTA